MTETIPMNADFTREKVDCGICYTDLTRKRTVSLPCSHVFHRTCLLDVCESKGVTLCRFECPLCRVLFAFTAIVDENGAKLPEIYGFGPTGQPAENEIVYVLKFPNRGHILDRIVTLTATFLQQVSAQLEAARKVGDKSEEYVKDILDERSKLTKRLRIMDEMLCNLDEINKRIRTAEDREVSISDSFEKVPGDPSALEVQPENSDEPTCGICFEALSRKKTCCFCRAAVSKVTGENGEDMKEPFPMESRKDDLLRSQNYLSHAKLESGRRVITSMMQQRHQQRRLALRDGKSAEWLADIDEEMERLRKRSKALDEYHMAVTEIKAIEAAEASAAAQVREGNIITNQPLQRVEPTAASDAAPVADGAVLESTEHHVAASNPTAEAGGHEQAVAQAAVPIERDFSPDLGHTNAPVLESTGWVVGNITMGLAVHDVSSDDDEAENSFDQADADALARARAIVRASNDMQNSNEGSASGDSLQESADAGPIAANEANINDGEATVARERVASNDTRNSNDESRQDAGPIAANDANVNVEEAAEPEAAAAEVSATEEVEAESSSSRRRRADDDADAAAAVEQKRRRS